MEKRIRELRHIPERRTPHGSSCACQRGSCHSGNSIWSTLTFALTFPCHFHQRCFQVGLKGQVAGAKLIPPVHLARQVQSSPLGMRSFCMHARPPGPVMRPSRGIRLKSRPCGRGHVAIAGLGRRATPCVARSSCSGIRSDRRHCFFLGGRERHAVSRRSLRDYRTSAAVWPMVLDGAQRFDFAGRGGDVGRPPRGLPWGCDRRPGDRIANCRRIDPRSCIAALSAAGPAGYLGAAQPSWIPAWHGQEQLRGIAGSAARQLDFWIYCVQRWICRIFGSMFCSVHAWRISFWIDRLDFCSWDCSVQRCLINCSSM